MGKAAGAMSKLRGRLRRTAKAWDALRQKHGDAPLPPVLALFAGTIETELEPELWLLRNKKGKTDG